jgi:hypothetical protein
MLGKAAEYHEAEVEEIVKGLSSLMEPVIIVALGLIVGSILIQSWLASHNPREADTPADERERLVLARAGNLSGIVLGFGCVAALMNYLVHPNGDLLFHDILLSLLVSTIAESALQIFFFHRGA